MSRLTLLVKALRELGPRQLGLYAWYQVLLRSGYLRWGTGNRRQQTRNKHLPSPVIRHVLTMPQAEKISDIIGDIGISRVLKVADEIVAGNFRRFGGLPVPIDLTPPGDLSHWTDYEMGRTPWGIDDIKFIWEPARFGWAYALGYGFLLSGDERYPQTFWRYFEVFMDANPSNQGPNWVSAQEVALRLLVFAFASQLFASSQHSSPERIHSLAMSIAEHANRIPLSLVYARAQNNNHLLSEAVGLITASLALPKHPKSVRWQRLGWKWFEWGLLQQIAVDGSYSQHSTNYHRLMLQLALWVAALRVDRPDVWQRLTPTLQRATTWLLSLTDPVSGCVPNLGPNDGAYIFPLTIRPFADFRPVLQAASLAFLGKPSVELGPWDDMSLWLAGNKPSGIGSQIFPTSNFQPPIPRNNIIHNQEFQSWAYLRSATFYGRPGHADQLHLDLWWRGLNIAQDAGTYLYNAVPPWDNTLTSTAVHNTVTLNGRDQMTRAGRFLFLDKAQAEVLTNDSAEDGSWERMITRHDGYLRSNAFHTRSVTTHQDGRWVVEDTLQPVTDRVQRDIQTVRLHWLLPDWKYEFDEEQGQLRIHSPEGWISLAIGSQPSVLGFTLVRAGEILLGRGDAHPTWGWVSPVYAHKEPALSFSTTVESTLPVQFFSVWIFPQ